MKPGKGNESVTSERRYAGGAHRKEGTRLVKFDGGPLDTCHAWIERQAFADGRFDTTGGSYNRDPDLSTHWTWSPA